MYVGALIAFVGAVLSVFSSYFQNYALLLSGIGLMAFGAASGLGVAFALIGDHYEKQDSAAVISKLSASFAILPALAILLGGYLVHHLSWQAGFYAFALYALFLFWLSMRLPRDDSASLDKNLGLKQVLSAYKKHCSNKNLLMAAAMMACATAFSYFYTALAPFIAISTLKVSPVVYGSFSMLPYAGFLVGTRFAEKMATRYGHFTNIFIGIFMLGISSLVLLLSFLFHFHEESILFIASFLLFFGSPSVFSNAGAMAMDCAKDKGTVASILNFINMLLALIGSIVFSALPIKSPLVFPVALFVLLILTLVLNLSLRRRLAT